MIYLLSQETMIPLGQLLAVETALNQSQLANTQYLASGKYTSTIKSVVATGPPETLSILLNVIGEEIRRQALDHEVIVVNIPRLIEWLKDGAAEIRAGREVRP